MNPTKDRYHEKLFLGMKQLNDGVMRGLYQLGTTGYYASYSLSVQKSTDAQYIIRGTISIRTEDGRVIKIARGVQLRNREERRRMRAAARKANRAAKKTKNKEGMPQEDANQMDEGKPRAEKFDISGRIALQSTDEKACRKAIADKAWALYHQYEDQLNASLRFQRTEEMCFQALVNRDGREYINRASKTPSGQEKRRRRLNKIARLLDDTPIEKLSERQMSTLCQMLGKNWAEYFKDASELLAYALDKRRDGVGCDPFAAYSERHAPRKKKDSAALQKEAKRQRTLTASQDDALLAQILAHPENGALIGVALSRWAGMSSRDVCELKLSAIQPMKEAPELMYIDFHIEKNAGATHNYSFPALPQLTEIINARRAYLAEQSINEENLRAASADDDPTKALQPKQLTDTCRIVTIGLGVENGAGFGLLQESYRQDLLNCGFIEDSGAYLFLCHKSLTNLVQADHYRSFTDETARYYLATMLLRARPLMKLATKSTQISRAKHGGKTYTSVTPLSNKETVTLSSLAKCKKGQLLLIHAEHGIVARAKSTEAVEKSSK